MMVNVDNKTNRKPYLGISVLADPHVENVARHATFREDGRSTRMMDRLYVISEFLQGAKKAGFYPIILGDLFDSGRHDSVRNVVVNSVKAHLEWLVDMGGLVIAGNHDQLAAGDDNRESLLRAVLPPANREESMLVQRIPVMSNGKHKVVTLFCASFYEQSSRIKEMMQASVAELKIEHGVSLVHLGMQEVSFRYGDTTESMPLKDIPPEYKICLFGHFHDPATSLNGRGHVIGSPTMMGFGDKFTAQRGWVDLVFSGNRLKVLRRAPRKVIPRYITVHNDRQLKKYARMGDILRVEVQTPAEIPIKRDMARKYGARAFEPLLVGGVAEVDSPHKISTPRSNPQAREDALLITHFSERASKQTKEEVDLVEVFEERDQLYH